MTSKVSVDGLPTGPERSSVLVVGARARELLLASELHQGGEPCGEHYQTLIIGHLDAERRPRAEAEAVARVEPRGSHGRRDEGTAA
jgi:hypothetical protein